MHTKRGRAASLNAILRGGAVVGNAHPTWLPGWSRTSNR